MAPTTKRIILFSVLGIAAIGGAIGYYLYNKGPVDVKNATGTKIAATALYQSFTKDSVQARKQYGDKIVEASGIVEKISQNQQNEAIILLKTGEGGAYVNCTMEGPATNIREKDSLSLKGICTGIGSGDVDLGILGDVYLVRCYLVKE
ncbi:MAG: hypothetical protein IPI66_04060 [Chitinophagaceae bacterium]|nr:hypothetical protein [Chitinophagaceae bacterium]MBL0055531.1 hypothetical protein [Chitinophagaceae bacterium]